VVGGFDIDIARCQNALDAKRLGELEGQLNLAIATLTLARADAAAEQARLRTETERWKLYAKPLYETAPAAAH